MKISEPVCLVLGEEGTGLVSILVRSGEPCQSSELLLGLGAAAALCPFLYSHTRTSMETALGQFHMAVTGLEGSLLFLPFDLLF